MSGSVLEVKPTEVWDLTFPNDHATIAWNNWLAQHIGKNNTESFVRAFYPPLNLLDQAFQRMYQLRWIDSASGDQLDKAGTIVGIGREIPNSIFFEFFGFETQYAGRAFGVARLRRRGERWATSTTLTDEAYRSMIRLKVAMNNGHGTAEQIAAAVDIGLGITGTYVQDMGNASFNIVITDQSINVEDPRMNLISYVVLKPAGVQMTIQFYYATNWDEAQSIWDGGESLWDVGVAPNAE